MTQKIGEKSDKNVEKTSGKSDKSVEKDDQIVLIFRPRKTLHGQREDNTRVKNVTLVKVCKYHQVKSTQCQKILTFYKQSGGTQWEGPEAEILNEGKGTGACRCSQNNRK